MSFSKCVNFSEKKKYLHWYSSFLVFTRITGKSLYHLFCPTSTMLHNENSYIWFLPAMFAVAKCRTQSFTERVNSVQKEHAHPIPLCLRKSCTVPFDGKFHFFMQMNTFVCLFVCLSDTLTKELLRIVLLLCEIF